MSRARNAAERAVHRVGESDASDGLLMVMIWIGLALCALWLLARQELRSRRIAPAWLRERLRLPRRLTPIGVPHKGVNRQTHQ